MSTSDPTVQTFTDRDEADERLSPEPPAREYQPARPTVTSMPRTPPLPGPPVTPALTDAVPAVPGARAPRPTSARPTGARPAPAPQARPPARTGGRPVQPGAVRRARLTVARVDPWGVLKLSFLLAVALGIVHVVAAVVVWNVVDGMGVFDDINNVMRQIEGEQSTFNVFDYVGLQRVLSLTTVIAVVNVVIITLMATLFAFLYNLGSALVGGTRVTLTDE